MYVGLISDTHGVFSDGFRKFLEPVDVIWHAGDFGGGISFAESIAAFKPVVGVCGNCDGQDIRYSYPQHQYLEVQGLKVLMTHIGLRRGSYWAYDPKRPVYDELAIGLIDTYRPDIFVCGHSHILKVMQDHEHKMLYINPGAAGLQGWQVVRTALRFRIESGEVKDMEVFELPRS